MKEENKGVSRVQIVEDVQAETPEQAIEKAKTICAQKYNLAPEDAHWENKDGAKKGFVFKVE